MQVCHGRKCVDNRSIGAGNRCGIQKTGAEYQQIIGGKGLNFIQQIDVRVTRSDGVVENGIIARPLFKGKSVSLASTTAPGYRDRAEVWATTPQGDKVKIFDAYIPFRTYN